jgi:hypothetical protein
VVVELDSGGIVVGEKGKNVLLTILGCERPLCG